MNDGEKLRFRVQVDRDLLRMVHTEITKMQRFIAEERTPLTPDRRSAVFDTLNLLQDGPP